MFIYVIVWRNKVKLKFVKKIILLIGFVLQTYAMIPENDFDQRIPEQITKMTSMHDILVESNMKKFNQFCLEEKENREKIFEFRIIKEYANKMLRRPTVNIGMLPIVIEKSFTNIEDWFCVKAGSLEDEKKLRTDVSLDFFTNIINLHTLKNVTPCDINRQLEFAKKNREDLETFYLLEEFSKNHLIIENDELKNLRLRFDSFEKSNNDKKERCHLLRCLEKFTNKAFSNFEYGNIVDSRGVVNERLLPQEFDIVAYLLEHI
jgi:hypothetical protein